MTTKQTASTTYLKITFAFLGMFSIIFAAGIVILLMRRSPEPIAHFTDIPSPPFMLADNYAYRQDNPDWGAQTIGSTSDSLASYGCTIASVAMAASNLLQTNISPGDMNTKLGNEHGYTKRGWLIWSKIEAATDGKVRAVVSPNPSHAAINQCMQNDGYPVIKIKLNDLITHWALIVGKTDSGYLIRDPLVGQSTDKPIRLSKRSHYIYATRCIQKTGN